MSTFEEPHTSVDVDFYVDTKVISAMREFAASGATTSQLLHHLNDSVRCELKWPSSSFTMKAFAMKCFVRSFSLNLGDVTFLAGWSGFGGPVSDASVDEWLTRDRLTVPTE
jgi:hypothetical protein